MTAHLHSAFVVGCYRCDLSRDEVLIPEHECDAGFFDRVMCPDPCNTMHSYCTVCDELQDACALDDEA